MRLLMPGILTRLLNRQRLLSSGSGFAYTNSSRRSQSTSHHAVASNPDLQSILQQFDTSNIACSFGYGLGVLQQAGYSDQSTRPQLDLIHIVHDTDKFHRANAEAHPEHYSALLKLGYRAIDFVQRSGAGIYFNPYVTMNDHNGAPLMIKYGVMSRERALADIRDWSYLYLAGRLHKPVQFLIESDDREFKDAVEHNLSSALKLAILLLLKQTGNSTLSAQRLFEKIALVSYMGDPRMLVGGENPNKVKNIVAKQLDLFSALYAPAIEEALEHEMLVEQGSSFKLNMLQARIAETISLFPLNFRRKLFKSYSNKYAKELGDGLGLDKVSPGNECLVPLHIASDHPFVQSIAQDKYLRATLLSTILGIIAYPALVQSLKGIFTAGVTKSAKYAWEKRQKGLLKQ